MQRKYWLLAILWALLILFFSFDYFSAGNTDSVFATIVGFFFENVSKDNMYIWHVRFRKFMHFFNYGLLSWFLLFGLTRSFHPLNKWTIKAALYALALCFLCASLDEGHQWFSDLRGGSIRDVLLDMSGAFFVQFYFFVRKGLQN